MYSGPERLHALRQNVPRQHGVDGDIVRRQFDGGGADEAQLSGLARRIVAPAWISGNRSGDRRGNDNAPLAPRLQRRETRIHRKKGPFEIDIRAPDPNRPRSSLRAWRTETLRRSQQTMSIPP